MFMKVWIWKHAALTNDLTTDIINICDGNSKFIRCITFKLDMLDTVSKEVNEIYAAKLNITYYIADKHLWYRYYFCIILHKLLIKI
jgi:hypothetical protein